MNLHFLPLPLPPPPPPPPPPPQVTSIRLARIRISSWALRWNFLSGLSRCWDPDARLCPTSYHAPMLNATGERERERERERESVRVRVVYHSYIINYLAYCCLISLRIIIIIAFKRQTDRQREREHNPNTHTHTHTHTHTLTHPSFLPP